VPFHQVVGVEHGTIVSDTFVVEISVRAPTTGGLFLTGSGEAYRKTLGGTKKLSGAELLTALLPQLDAKVKTSTPDRQMEDVGISWMPSVARRARVVRPLLHGARALWVDDNPSNNLYERMTLASLGVMLDLALTTDEALYMAARVSYDLVLSDMRRGSNPAAGIEILDELRRHGLSTPVVFYTALADPTRPTPIGAFGLTNRPDELLHYAFDVLERRGSGTR
jgi:CheY-like chemotaxis protein